jgi:hypothetical protein
MALGIAVRGGAQSGEARSRAVENLRIGLSTDPQAAFVAIPSVRAANDGEFVAIVRYAASAAVVWFDRNGQRRWRRDFQIRDGLSDVAVTADTAAILRGSGGEMEIGFFKAGGSNAFAQVRLPADPGTRTSLIGWSGGSVLVLRVTHSDIEGARSIARVRPRYEVIKVEPGTGRAGTVWDRDDPATYALTRLPPPLDRHIVETALPWDVTPHLVAVPQGLCVSWSSTPQLECMRWSNPTRDTIRFRMDQPRIFPQMHREWLNEWRLAGARHHTDSSFQIISQLPAPSTLSVIGGLFHAHDGSIAVVRRDLRSSPISTADSVHIDIVSRTGELQTSLLLPPGMQVQAYTGKAVFATFIDIATVASRSQETGAPRPLFQIVRFRIEQSP